MTISYIGYDDALALINSRIQPLKPEPMVLAEAAGHVAAIDVVARVDAPSSNASLKDGFAVCGTDVHSATEQTPIRLSLIGDGAAGRGTTASVQSGTAVRLRTGAQIPDGADAVVASEFATDGGHWVDIERHAEPGRNILAQGSDVSQGEIVVPAGQLLTPGRIGLLAAAGTHQIPVAPRPTVAILATGDEVVMPGLPLATGQVYASNQATLEAWCRQFHLSPRLGIAGDDAEAISNAIVGMLPSVDAIITSGGAWTSDKDYMARVLGDLGWERLFHRVRLGPGKAVGAGLLDGKPVFILPGGPPSNLAAFLLLALPGLQRLAGRPMTPFPEIPALLGADVKGQADWTQVIYGTLSNTDQGQVFSPSPHKSRLRSMADADALVLNPEGSERILAGSRVLVQRLD